MNQTYSILSLKLLMCQRTTEDPLRSQGASRLWEAGNKMLVGDSSSCHDGRQRLVEKKCLDPKGSEAYIVWWRWRVQDVPRKLSADVDIPIQFCQLSNVRLKKRDIVPVQRECPLSAVLNVMYIHGKNLGEGDNPHVFVFALVITLAILLTVEHQNDQR